MAPTLRRWFYVDDELFQYRYDTETLVLSFDISRHNTIPIQIYIAEMARIIAQTPHSNWHVWFYSQYLTNELREMVDAFDEFSDSTSPTFYRHENGTVVPDDDDDLDLDEFEFEDTEPEPELAN